MLICSALAVHDRAGILMGYIMVPMAGAERNERHGYLGSQVLMVNQRNGDNGTHMRLKRKVALDVDKKLKHALASDLAAEKKDGKKTEQEMVEFAANQREAEQEKALAKPDAKVKNDEEAKKGRASPNSLEAESLAKVNSGVKHIKETEHEHAAAHMNRTGATAYLVWFKGLRKTDAPEGQDGSTWIRALIDVDAFTFAGHFAVADSDKCAPFGYGPKLGSMSQSEALNHAKQGGKWQGEWSDDKDHFKRACNAGAKVFYKQVTCDAGSGLPDAGQKDYQYAFPCVNDPDWLVCMKASGIFNCATFPSSMPGEDSKCHVPKVLECQRTGKMDDCPKEGHDDWCFACNDSGR